MNQYLVKDDKTRYGLLDSVRGICILGMVVYHTLFDIFVFRGTENTNGWFAVLDVVRDIGAAAFIFIAGVCYHFGSHKLRRFLVLTVSGAVVWVVTRFLVPDAAVVFGILTFMGASGGMLALSDPMLRRIPPLVGFLISLLLFAFTFNVNFGSVGFFRFPVFEVPRCFYANYFTAFLGFPFVGFSSGDYYPIFPWIWMSLSGYFFFPLIGGTKKAHPLLMKNIPVLSAVGRYSLPVYLLHQPLIFCALFVFNFLSE